MEAHLAPLTVQFLAWVAARPRRHAELLECWQSSCPRLTVWEDALADGLVRFANGAAGPAHLALTPRGRALLDRRG